MDQINEVTPLRIGYFSGEEHTDQVLQRVQRIMGESDNVSDSLFVYHSPHFEDIISTSKEQHFDCIVIDSIQTVYSTAQDASAGSPNQVKYCAEKLSEFCKQEQITCFVIGHITKG